MTTPCMLGFRCPIRKMNDEHEDICTYPYITIGMVWTDTRTGEPYHPRCDDTFPMPDNMESADCPLMTPDCKLEDILRRVEQ